MVVPYETGKLVRSLVRVPGSGNDSTLPSECLDLSKVSTYAATVYVSRTLPPALARPRQTANDSETSNRMERPRLQKTPTAPPVQKTVNKRKYTELQESRDGQISTPVTTFEETSSTPTPSKKPRVVYLTTEQVLSAVRAGSIIAVPLQQVQQQNLPQQSLNFSAAGSPSASVSQLLQERNALREENKALQRQLLLFQQLFKNKGRLASVVQRLGVRMA